MNELMDEIIRSTVVVIFAIGQVVILGLVTTAFKMYLDVRDLKKSMDAAFSKIRNLENNTYE